MNTVPGYGNTPNDFMLIGESPGENEFKQQRPFVGKSGHEQEQYLSRHGVSPRSWFMTNVVKEFIPTNPDPTQEQIEYWTPKLEQEISTVKPKLIIAVGRFAARWFLGDTVDLDECHGLPHRGGEFDSSRRDRSQGAVVIPTYHPAFGFYSPEAKTLINWDYQQVAETVKLIRSNRQDEIQFRTDEMEGCECYLDVTGQELSDLIDIDNPHEIGLDTEGIPSNPWSIQVSTMEGTAYVLRVTRGDFSIGIAALQRLVDRGCLIITHDAGTPEGCMYDTMMCRAMGLELTDAHIFNTMYSAFLLRTESKGLKTLLYRWCGMKMEDYLSIIGDVGKQKQVEYLCNVLSHEWVKPETRMVRHNDGSVKPYTPKSISSFTTAILQDVASGKVNKKGELTNPYARWKGGQGNNGLDRELRRQVESVLGPMPIATLDDIELDKAIFYAGKDADGTRRLKPVLLQQLAKNKVEWPMDTGMQVLPMFEEMQREGMPASRSKFKELTSYVEGKLIEIQSEISTKYYNGKPFNPASGDQVAALMRRRALTGEKRTSTGKMSTSKKSIEHLREQDEAIDLMFTWREHQKIHSTYCLPILEIADNQPVDNKSPDMFIVRCKIKPVTVATRRLSSEDPSLLNVPIRSELGRRVRECYVTDEDEVFGAWDFSGQEMRVAAHVSKDRLLCKLFIEGRDPHTEAAVRVFGIPIDQVDKFDHRLPAKTANFGILYGLTGSGLLDLFRMFGLQWKLDDCEKLIREILRSVYPEMSACIKDIQRETARTGMVRDLYGMIRYLPMAWSDNKKESSEAGRQAFSHVIQGTAQGMMQNAMAWLRPRFREIQKAQLNLKVCLQIHDELIVRMDPLLWDMVDEMVMDAFVNRCGIKLRVPIECEGHMGRSWSSLK